MTEKEFAGKVEFLQEAGLENDVNYCQLEVEGGGMLGFSSLKNLAENVAWEYGKDFKRHISYVPPEYTDYRGCENQLCPRRYHGFTDSEIKEFEKEVQAFLARRKSCD